MRGGRLKTLRSIALFIAAWGFAAWALRPASHPIWQLLPEFSYDLGFVVWSAGKMLSFSYQAALYITTFLLPIAFLVRTIARARVRASLSDPLARARRFVGTRLGGALVVAPAIVWSVLLYLYANARNASLHHRAPWDEQLITFFIPAIIAFIGHALLLKRGANALFAPTLEDGEAKQDEHAEGFTFDAVAVTRETRGAVAALAALSIVATGVAFWLPTPTLMHSPVMFGGLLTYVAVAAGSAFAFRRASRISIGVDGVLIGGTSRTRFFSYRDIDGARAKGGDLELLRGEKVVLRLQLHGKDATRREALLARLQAAIEQAAISRRDPATGFVEGAGAEELTLAAAGAATYRGRTAPTREKLWELLEGPAIDSDRRRAAATALARTMVDAAESERLRVAVEQFAEPSARSGIHDLLNEEEEEKLAPALRKMVRR